MAHATHDMQLMDGDELEGEGVEEEDSDGAKVLSGIDDVGLVEGERDERVVEDPAVLGPLAHEGDFIGLGVDGDRFVEVTGMDSEDLEEPVGDGPLGAVLPAPGGLHGVFGVGVCVTHGGWW